MQEQIKHDPTTGQLLTNDTWVRHKYILVKVQVQYGNFFVSSCSHEMNFCLKCIKVKIPPKNITRIFTV